jgi:GT2 family glycosyltransferase
MSDSRSALVGVVIVNWNGWQHTLAACQSLDQSLHQAFKVIIVDNASSDDSLARLRTALPQVEIIANSVNAGFSGGCNIGIRRALDLECDYIFLLNNDALAESQTISRLIDASRSKNDAALLGSAVVFASSGRYQFFGSRTGKVVGMSEYFNAVADAQLLQQEFIKTDFILGAALFLPAAALTKTGLFDERFFLNYEETDLCYRARDLGIDSFIVPSSLVRHHANSTLGPYTAPMQSYFLTRNALLFADKHAPLGQRLRAYKYHLATFYWNIRKSWEAGSIMDRPSRAMARAFWDYGMRRFGDCPALIRRYDALHRGHPYLPSSYDGRGSPLV